eukprot:6637932-Alexandrium_andersonii.AAC.1
MCIRDSHSPALGLLRSGPLHAAAIVSRRPQRCALGPLRAATSLVLRRPQRLGPPPPRRSQ